MRRLPLVISGTAYFFCCGGAAFAQVADPAISSPNAVEGPADGGEIVVTALRRNEKLQDVPVSITALSGQQLAEQRMDSPNDLAGSVPNLQATTLGGEGLPIFSLRGVSMSDFSFNQQGPVATYYDEVYKGSFPLLPVGLYDLERVEVLRGPQGTLYGKNTTGGAINFISRKPRYETEAELSLSYGNYNRHEANGAIQAPLGENVAARIAFTFARADGWFKNLLPGESDLNATRQYGIRASFLAEPSDEIELILRLSTSLQNPINYGIFARPGPDGTGAGVYEAFGGSSYFRTGLGKREIESDDVSRRRHRTYGTSLTANWQVSDTLTLTSVSSYDYGKLFVPEDADGSPLDVDRTDNKGRARQFAQDLRLASDYDGAFNFILGAYYNVEKIHAETALSFFTDIDTTGDGAINADDCLQDFFLTCVYRNRYDQTKKSAAIYADAKYEISDRVILRGGLRYTGDKGTAKNYTAQVLGADGTPIGNTIPGDPNNFDAAASDRFKTDNVSGKIGLDFKIADDNLVYVSFSRGYRANAFNAQAFFLPEELNVAKPETVNAYEAGFKTQFLDRAVTFNGAVFYYDYKNQQALDLDPNTAAQTLVNIPKSRIFGAELELVARPVKGLRLNAGLGVLDTKIERGQVSGVVLDGNRLPAAPAVSLNAGFDWDLLDNDSGKVTFGLNGSYNSKQYFDLFNTERLAQKNYILANSQISYRTADQRYGVSVWGRNIFNKFYYRGALDLSGFGFDSFQVGEPRTYGLTFDLKF